MGLVSEVNPGDSPSLQRPCTLSINLVERLCDSVVPERNCMAMLHFIMSRWWKLKTSESEIENERDSCKMKYQCVIHAMTNQSTTLISTQFCILYTFQVAIPISFLNTYEAKGF